MKKKHSIEQIPIDYTAPDWFEKQYLNSINAILESVLTDKNTKKRVNQVTEYNALQAIFLATQNYFENLTYEDNKTARAAEIGDALSLLGAVLEQSTPRKEENVLKKTLGVGQFIDVLIHFGMPRIAAIEATSKWLQMGKSTVRTHNEVYRAQIKKDKKFSMRGHILFSPYADLIKEHLQSHPNDFPLRHPKAKKAFLACKELYKEDLKSITSGLASKTRKTVDSH